MVRHDSGREEGEDGFSYVPVDPCQPVIAALRCALCFIRSEERRSAAVLSALTALDQEIVCLLAGCPAGRTPLNFLPGP